MTDDGATIGGIATALRAAVGHLVTVRIAGPDGLGNWDDHVVIQHKPEPGAIYESAQLRVWGAVEHYDPDRFVYWRVTKGQDIVCVGRDWAYVRAFLIRWADGGIQQ